MCEYTYGRAVDRWITESVDVQVGEWADRRVGEWTIWRDRAGGQVDWRGVE